MTFVDVIHLIKVNDAFFQWVSLTKGGYYFLSLILWYRCCSVPFPHILLVTNSVLQLSSKNVSYFIWRLQSVPRLVIGCLGLSYLDTPYICLICSALKTGNIFVMTNISQSFYNHFFIYKIRSILSVKCRNYCTCLYLIVPWLLQQPLLSS